MKSGSLSAAVFARRGFVLAWALCLAGLAAGMLRAGGW